MKRIRHDLDAQSCKTFDSKHQKRIDMLNDFLIKPTPLLFDVNQIKSTLPDLSLLLVPNFK